MVHSKPGWWPLAVASVVLVATSFAGAPAGDENAAALVAAASGSLTVSEAGRPDRRAETLDWLRDGSVIDVAADATVSLALASGRRYSATGPARARIRATAVEPVAGRWLELPSNAPLPRLEPLASEARPGARSGALRVRGRRLARLYPRRDAVTLAGETTLEFAATTAATEYHVEIEDDHGDTVFHATISSARIRVPAGILQPGRRYAWSVRGNTPEGLARGEAEFSTLDEESAARRERLRASLPDHDAASLALLAEVDRGLGLLHDARDGFEAALAKAPADAGLRRALDDMEARLQEPGQSE